MGNTDVGAWKLLIYPIAFILLVGTILNLAIAPFISAGITAPNNPTFFTTAMSTILSATSSVMPTSVYTFINTNILAFGYLPSLVQNVTGVLISVCFLYIGVVIVTSFIP